MAGPDPAIYVLPRRSLGVDTRIKSGHDGGGVGWPAFDRPIRGTRANLSAVILGPVARIHAFLAADARRGCPDQVRAWRRWGMSASPHHGGAGPGSLHIKTIPVSKMLFTRMSASERSATVQDRANRPSPAPACRVRGSPLPPGARHSRACAGR